MDTNGGNMKIEEKVALNGNTVRFFTPESQEDVEKLERWEEEGILDYRLQFADTTEADSEDTSSSGSSGGQ